jgi:uncharacterized coiled-coil protein SlyX
MAVREFSLPPTSIHLIQPQATAAIPNVDVNTKLNEVWLMESIQKLQINHSYKKDLITKLSTTVNELLAANAELQDQVRNLTGGADMHKGNGVGGRKRKRKEGSGEGADD